MGLLNLFRPRWKNTNPSVRLEAVRKCSNDVAFEVLISELDAEICHMALGRICDQNRLCKLIEQSPEAEWALAAVGVLTEQEELQRLATLVPRGGIGEAAVARLRDEKLLLETISDVSMFMDDDNPDQENNQVYAAIVLRAVGQLLSQRALVEVALSGAPEDARLAAVRRIEDPQVLVRVFTRDWNPDICGEALSRLPDSELEKLLSITPGLSLESPPTGNLLRKWLLEQRIAFLEDFAMVSFTKALRHFELAVKLTPNNADICVKIGKSWLALGMEKEALENFQRAQQIDPSIASIVSAALCEEGVAILAKSKKQFDGK